MKNHFSVINGLIVFLFFILPFGCMGQVEDSESNRAKFDFHDDSARISLRAAVIDEPYNLSNEAISLLADRMNQVCTRHGLASSAANNRFQIVAYINYIDMDAINNGTPFFRCEMDISFYIIDYANKQMYASTIHESPYKGMGKSKNEAYKAAIRKIRRDDEIFVEFLAEGKQKILSYYDSQCDFIMARAKSLAEQNQFDEAFRILAEVPPVSKGCYEKALTNGSSIYKSYQREKCFEFLSKAEIDGSLLKDYESAAKYLKSIPPSSECYERLKEHLDYLVSRKFVDEEITREHDLKIAEAKLQAEKLRYEASMDKAGDYRQVKADYSQVVN